MSKWTERGYSAVVMATRHGLLKKVGETSCEKCGAPSQVKHHEDYSRPLDVIYLCGRCHAARHQELGWGFGTRPTGLIRTLRTMKAGDSFLYSYNNGLHQIAKDIGIRIRTKKQAVGYRIWRTA